MVMLGLLVLEHRLCPLQFVLGADPGLLDLANASSITCVSSSGRTLQLSAQFVVEVIQ